LISPTIKTPQLAHVPENVIGPFTIVKRHLLKHLTEDKVAVLSNSSVLVADVLEGGMTLVSMWNPLASA
jgi:hypothetical protein